MLILQVKIYTFYKADAHILRVKIIHSITTLVLNVKMHIFYKADTKYCMHKCVHSIRRMLILHVQMHTSCKADAHMHIQMHTFYKVDKTDLHYLPYPKQANRAGVM